MRVKQRKVYEEFAANIPEDTVKGWEEMLSAWNADPTKPDPYNEPTSCKLRATVDFHELALTSLYSHHIRRGQAPAQPGRSSGSSGRDTASPRHSSGSVPAGWTGARREAVRVSSYLTLQLTHTGTRW